VVLEVFITVRISIRVDNNVDLSTHKIGECSKLLEIFLRAIGRGLNLHGRMMLRARSMN
jgi:hypothetical protein